MQDNASPRPWKYRNEPIDEIRRRDWIEDALGEIVVENVGHIDGPLVCDAVNLVYYAECAVGALREDNPCT